VSEFRSEIRSQRTSMTGLSGGVKIWTKCLIVGYNTGLSRTDGIVTSVSRVAFMNERYSFHSETDSGREYSVCKLFIASHDDWQRSSNVSSHPRVINSCVLTAVSSATFSDGLVSIFGGRYTLVDSAAFC